MQQRRAGNGRPSGTDGSDFSYRMVVDSRYTKVAQGKSRLSALISTQAIIQLFGAVNIYLSSLKEDRIDKLSVSSTIVCFISLLIGELGRKHSLANFLKLFAFGSSIAILLSFACIANSNVSLEIIQNLSGWEIKKFELFKIAGVLLGLLVQIFTFRTTVSLVHNMAPPKRT